jgi:ribosomal protein L40E
MAKVCLKCNRQASEAAMFCDACGSQLTEDLALATNASGAPADSTSPPHQSEVVQPSAAQETPQPKQCPKCYGEVDERALVCLHCQFEIANYDENLRRRYLTTMRKVPGKVPSRWGKDYALNTGRSVSINLIQALLGGVLGTALLFVPVVGWIIGPLLLLGSIGCIAIAMGAPILNLFTNKRSRVEIVSGSVRARNTYTDTVCPGCKARDPIATVMNFPQDNYGHLVCRHCGETSLRVNDQLLWVPFPAARLNPSASIEQFFTILPTELAPPSAAQQPAPTQEIPPNRATSMSATDRISAFLDQHFQQKSVGVKLLLIGCAGLVGLVGLFCLLIISVLVWALIDPETKTTSPKNVAVTAQRSGLCAPQWPQMVIH